MNSTGRGISLLDWENMTVGMILDHIITYNNMHYKDEDEEQERDAKQSDFDKF